MVSYQTYLYLHLLGIGALFFVLGGLFLHAVNGGTKETNILRKPSAAMHGIALFLILLSGFGMLARIGSSTHEWWVLLKVLIWIGMGAAIMIPLRFTKLARPLWYLLPIVLLLAAWVATAKPGNTVEDDQTDVEVVAEDDAAEEDADAAEEDAGAAEEADAADDEADAADDEAAEEDE